VALVNLKSIKREQMHRHGVAAEGIEQQHIEVLRRFALQIQPRIAHDDLQLATARFEVRQVSEVFAGDGNDVGIDVVKPEGLAFLPIRRHGGGAHADDADLCIRPLAQAFQGPADAVCCDHNR